MASISGVTQFTAARLPARAAAQERPMAAAVAMPWRSRPRRAVAVFAAPDKLGDKVAESVKEAEEKCSEDPTSGECVAAWDEVEELSAAASHARDRKKENSDPLEAYCKDNPETDECRTYDN